MPDRVSTLIQEHHDAQIAEGVSAYLTKHELHHIPALKIDPIIFQRRMVKGCSSFKCDATCCKFGVWADMKERDRILEHKDLIIRYMEDHQPKDPGSWFDDTVEDDPDFPSAKAVGTQAHERGCVFLLKDGKCVLQVAATREGMDKYAIKPFYCVAYPVVVAQGELTLDDPSHANRPECCSYVNEGEERGIEVFREEFKFVLGEQGLRELKDRCEAYRKKAENESS